MFQNIKREAILFRIVTVATLVYLPAIFISVSGHAPKPSYHPLPKKDPIFFSTDVIRYLNEENTVSFLFIDLQRWVGVIAPFTMLTLFLAGWWHRRTRQQSSYMAGNQWLL